MGALEAKDRRHACPGANQRWLLVLSRKGPDGAESRKWTLATAFIMLTESAPKHVAENHLPTSRLSVPAQSNPIAIVAAEAALRSTPSLYPEPFASQMQGREKRPLGDIFGLANFGVNLTRIRPSGVSALRHAHGKQDEFIYVIEGRPTLCTDEGETRNVRKLVHAEFSHVPSSRHRLDLAVV